MRFRRDVNCEYKRRCERKSERERKREGGRKRELDSEGTQIENKKKVRKKE